MGNLLPEGSLHRGDEMKDLCVTLKFRKGGGDHAAEFADAAEIVPLQICDHDKFRDFLRGGFELQRLPLVRGIFPPTGSCSLDGSGQDASAAHFEKAFRRAGENPFVT